MKTLTQIENKLSTLTEGQVIYAINESMACNYQGIIWDKAKGYAAVADTQDQLEIGKDICYEPLR